MGQERDELLEGMIGLFESYTERWKADKLSADGLAALITSRVGSEEWMRRRGTSRLGATEATTQPAAARALGQSQDDDEVESSQGGNKTVSPRHGSLLGLAERVLRARGYNMALVEIQKEIESGANAGAPKDLSSYRAALDRGMDAKYGPLIVRPASGVYGLAAWGPSGRDKEVAVEQIAPPHVGDLEPDW